jgi:hypothetical protein
MSMTEGQKQRRARLQQAKRRLRAGLIAADPNTGGVRVREQQQAATRRRVRARDQQRLVRHRSQGGRRKRQRMLGDQHGIRLGTLVNQVGQGAGSQRRGKKAQIVFDPRKRAFFHDYGGQIGRVRIRRSNPLTKRYSQLLADYRAKGIGRRRPRRPRAQRQYMGGSLPTSTTGPNA